jgi:hypothetical protein
MRVYSIVKRMLSTPRVLYLAAGKDRCDELHGRAGSVRDCIMCVLYLAGVGGGEGGARNSVAYAELLALTPCLENGAANA